MLKKIIKSSLMLITCFAILLLTACSKSPNDEAFISNIQKGLEKRWKLTGTEEKYDDYKDYLRECVNTELGAIGDISEYEFEDQHLGELANSYVDALNAQLEGASYYNSDDAKFDEYFSENGFNRRVLIIKELYDDYGLTVKDDYKNDFEDIINVAAHMEEVEAKLSAIQTIVSENITLTSLGGAEYEMVIENTTEYDLTNAELCFNFYDEDGVLVESDSAYMNSWTSGSKGKADIYVNSAFDSVEMAISFVDPDSYEEIKTDYSKIAFVNDVKVELELITDLPAEIEYTSQFDGELYSSCTITDFSYVEDGWYNGEASVKLKISGTKTYDEDGDSISKECYVGWKMYDENGNVVSSGQFYTDAVKTDESFKNSESYVSNLTPGKYTIELIDVQW